MEYNPNPTVYATAKPTRRRSFGGGNESSMWITDDDARDSELNEDSDSPEPIDQDEIFALIRSISDPEHPNMTLEQLMVVSAPQVAVLDNHVAVEFTPTVPHCGASTLIGLSIRVRLLRSLPQRYKIDIRVKPGSHQSEHAVNKQLNDKERVAAALENPALLDVVEGCLATTSGRAY